MHQNYQPGSTGHGLPTERIDVRALIDRSRISAFQIWVVACCCVVLLLDGFDAVMIAYVAPELIRTMGVAPTKLGTLFASGLAGLTFGAFLCGPAADRFGRKPVLIASVVIFGGFTLATAGVDSLWMIVVLRFLAGIGLGGAGPSAMALVAELSPTRVRSSQIAWLGCGIPLGGALAGFVAAKLIPEYGWKSMFVLGGALPLAIVLGLMLWLPESIRFLLVQPGGQERVRQLMSKLVPEHETTSAQQFITSAEASEAGGLVAELFRHNLARSTIALWISAFCMLMVTYFFANWLPVLFRATSYSMEQTSLLLGLFLFGSPLGSLSVGYLMNRTDRYVSMAVCAFVAAACFIVISYVVTDIALAAVTITLLGASCGACVTGTSILASFIYPNKVRATGIGWTTGFARVGSIVGAMSGGWLLASGIPLATLLQVTAMPCVLGLSAFLYLKGSVRSIKVLKEITPEVNA